MAFSDYLTLKQARLKPLESWSCKQAGLLFLLPRAGVGCVVRGPDKRSLAKGDLLVLSVSSDCQVRGEANGGIQFWWFSVCLEHLYPLFDGHEISLLTKLAAKCNQHSFHGSNTPLAMECHKLLDEIPPRSTLDHRGQLLRVAAAVLNAEFAAVGGLREEVGRIEEHILEVFEKLTVEEILNLPVGDLARKFSCGRRHLNRLFHQFFGISVAAMRMEMRLLKAVTLLRDREAKVTRVAEACGFNHLGLFNTCFKRRFGVSPGQWRKQQQPGGSSAAELLPPGTECPLHGNGLCPWTGRNAVWEATVGQPVKLMGHPAEATLVGKKFFGGPSAFGPALDGGHKSGLKPESKPMAVNS
jgi:AraC-like DNA-binding protein